jgi:hypothetical protein
MHIGLKSISGVVAGGMVAAVAYWIAVVVAFLIMHGIPLGSPGGPPTTADVSTHLAFAAAASFCGALVAVRIAGHQPCLHALVLGGLLGLSVFLGFSKPASHWPAWFPYGMALACGCGAVLAGRFASLLRSGPRRSVAKQKEAE